MERRSIKRIMKSLQGPYDRFRHHYPLEEAVDLYMEIWYDSSSSSNEEWTLKLQFRGSYGCFIFHMTFVSRSIQINGDHTTSEE